MKIRKRRVFFRIFPGNRLTIPLLLNIWEANGLDRCFEIHMADDAPGRLTFRPGTGSGEGDVFIYSFMTPHLPWIGDEIGYLRSQAARVAILAAGGPHVSAEPELAVACGFNVIFRGPGEDTFMRFGRDLLAGNVPTGTAVIYDGRAGAAMDNLEPKTVFLAKLSPGFRLFENGAAAGNNPGLFLALPLLPDRRRETELSGP